MFILFVPILFFLTFAEDTNYSVNEEFENYKIKFQKRYENLELENEAKNAYINASDFIRQHRILCENNKDISYTLEENEFSDIPIPVIKKYLINRLINNRLNRIKVIDSDVSFRMDLPTSLNLESLLGIKTPVQNQGLCGSCYTFVSADAIAAQWYKKYKTYYNLSQQQLIDCSTSYGNLGCSGGLEIFTYDYLLNSEGITTSELYPYTGKEATCSYKSGTSASRITNYMNYESLSDLSLMSILYQYGPLTVAIDASDDTFLFYKSGIFYSAQCQSDINSLNHSMLLIGYSQTTSGIEYWIVKNSWGKSWGMDGYVFIAKNGNNTCGIRTDITYPII